MKLGPQLAFASPRSVMLCCWQECHDMNSRNKTAPCTDNAPDRHSLCHRARYSKVQSLQTSVLLTQTGELVRYFSLFPKCPDRLEGHPAPYPVGTVDSSPREIKRVEREADDSPPFNEELRMGGTISQLSHTSSWCGA
jgi:hypothetical protein